MANQNMPRGFMPIIQYTPNQVHKYYKSANVQLGIYDPVIRVAGSTDPSGRYGAVTRATSGASNSISGVVVGFETAPGVTYNYLKAADAGYVLVVDDPNVELLVQDDGSAVLDAADIGKHITAVTAVDCNTSTGISKMQLDATSLGATGTFVLVRSDDDPRNEPNAAYQNWVVKVANHTEVNAGANNITNT